MDFLSPTTWADALAAKAEHPGAVPIAGGTDVMVELNFDRRRPPALLDLTRIADLAEHGTENGTIRLGAGVPYTRVIAELGDRLPGLAQASRTVGSPQIRNRGTVGGSLAHADPAAEWTALALALDAELDLVGPGGARTVPAAEFLISYFTTALEPGELLTGLRLNVPNGRSGSCFLELARRHGDFAIAGVGALVTLDGEGSVGDARVALIGVGERAVRVAAAEELLRGRRPTAELFAEAAAAVQAELDPNSDVHATADYRRHVAGVLVRRALATAVGRAGGGDRDGAA
jgi:CO/xanthine dehydrogenase FAD-binding subunit